MNTRRYIEDYALIGSTEGAGLVHRDGTIEWLCMPAFDSEAIFASLLGGSEHGSWRLGAVDAAADVSRRYVPDTMILETTIETTGGTATVYDFMPLPAIGGTSELIRIVRVSRGSVELRCDLVLRFAYGERSPWLQCRDGTIHAVAGPHAVRLSSSMDLHAFDLTSPTDFTVSADQTVTFALEYHASHVSPPLPRDANALLRHAETHWRRWASNCSYDGPYSEIVRRSLLTLKALTYGPTGGIIAAPTTSLPEVAGGERNWDYRYCWLRDAVLTIYALAGSGYREEASAWRWWLMRAVAGAPEELQIMYGLRGEMRITETELRHLPGYEASSPVRIGNAAHEQLQLDVYGAVLAAFDAARRGGLADMDTVWPLQLAVARRLLDLWREPDSGLWETRGPPRHFVFSKVMCWLAFDRMIASAKDFELEGPIDEWTGARDAIHADVCEHGFDADMNSFVQFYGAKKVDASLLRLAMVGFLPPDDPRILGTISRVENELLRDGLVYRYLNDPDDGDGLAGREGAFLACSFWLCDAYATSGRLDEAKDLFERLTSLGSDLGLFAEEYDPVAARQLGNFPQAFSHFALVNTALTLAGAEGGMAAHLVGTRSTKQGANMDRDSSGSRRR